MGGDYQETTLMRSVRAYPFIAQARDAEGLLLGYISAFSDGVFSTMLGELVVHPATRGQGIGRALLATVETEFAGIPIYVKALGDAKRFFEACGYRIPSGEVTAMFKNKKIT